MTRLSKTQYDQRVFAAMAVYVALVLLLLPQARHAETLLPRLTSSLLPTVPMLYVLWLLGKRIWQSDELEQRMHLIGLGAASAVVGVFSLIGGFLAVAKVVPHDAAATLLLWTFPILMFSYSIARTWAARHYGGGICEETDGIPMHRRFLVLTLMFVVIAAWAYFRSNDDVAVGVFCGFATGFALAALILALRRWRQSKHADR